MPHSHFNRLVQITAMAAVLTCLTFTHAEAQEKREPEGTPLPSDAKVYPLSDLRSPVDRLDAPRGGLPVIMLTGYWPPTNDMLRQFSDNLDQNPDGWVGGNWEDRGYDVYAFFPEFPQGLGKGEGDFEVDYQDTSGDWWPLVDEIHPIAIITFGRAGVDSYWEIEYRTRNLPYATWANDYLTPFKPTPSPPDGDVDAGTIRYSTLPMYDISSAVTGAGLGIQGIVDTNSTDYAGAFLCEFIGYHACWYHDLNAGYSDPDRNIAAGHIHVGSNILTPEATAAVEVTLRTLTAHLDETQFLPGDMNCDRFITIDDIPPFVMAILDPDAYEAAYSPCERSRADMNDDTFINGADIQHLIGFFHADCNASGLPDDLDIEHGFSEDCDANGIPDECDIEAGTLADENENGIPDICEDDTPPLPDPLDFVYDAPYTFASGAGEITLTSETATDDTDPVEYYFSCTAGNCHDSPAWSTSTEYIDTGLAVNSFYTYKVQARDGAIPPNMTDLDTAESVRIATLANEPGAPTLNLGTPPQTEMTIEIDAAGNPSWTKFAIQCTDTTDANWAGQYLDGDGNPSAAPVWKSAVQWDVAPITGLLANTDYSFAVMAKNLDNVETDLGPLTTLATAE